MFIKFLMSILVFLMFVDNADAGVFFKRCCRRNVCTYQPASCNNPNKVCANTPDEDDATCTYTSVNSTSKLASPSTDTYYSRTNIKSTLPDPSELYPDLYYAMVGEENPNKVESKKLLASNNESLDELDTLADINVDIDFVGEIDSIEDSSEVSLTKADTTNKLFEKTSLVKDEVSTVKENATNKKVTEDKKEVTELKEETDTIVLSKDELDLVEEINKLRTAHKLSKVVVSKKLMESAKKQSDAMIKAKRVYHNLSAIPHYTIQSITSSSSVSNAISTWKNSYNGNYANILNPNHKYIGVAVDSGFFTLQLSGSDENK